MTTQQLLDLVDAKIEALVNSPQVDYTEGDVTVKASQKIGQLTKLRTKLIASPDAEVTRMAFDFNIDEFGIDNADYED